MIETLDDVIEYAADQAGVYGAHDDGEKKTCRVCWVSNLRERIVAAIEIEKRLYPENFRVEFKQ